MYRDYPLVEEGRKKTLVRDNRTSGQTDPKTADEKNTAGLVALRTEGRPAARSKWEILGHVQEKRKGTRARDHRKIRGTHPRD